MAYELTHFSKAKQELALATRIDVVKVIRDRAELFRAYAKQAGASLEVQNQAAEIKIRAERRAGEILNNTHTRPGGRPRKLLHDATVSGDALMPSLEQLGIERTQAHRWRRIADIPENVFDAHVKDTTAAKKELTTASILAIAKGLKRQSRRTEAIRTNTVDDLQILIDAGEKYGTLYGDPPWSYSNQSTRAAAVDHYGTMAVDEIARLPIKQLAADESHLHLWTTNAFFVDAQHILEAWGFEYKSCFVWVKPQMGIGNYWRVSHEFLLLGVRGGLQFQAKDEKSWIEAKRLQHSHKPESVRQKIERVSPGPRLELFGRRVIDGWTVWGNEVEVDLVTQSAMRTACRAAAL